MGVLWFDTVQRRTKWNDQDISFRGNDGQRWFEFLKLLAEHFPNGVVGVDDIAELEGFRTLKPTIIGKVVSRYIRDSLKPKVGCDLVLPQAGKSEAFFTINSSVVERIEWYPARSEETALKPFRAVPGIGIEELSLLALAEAKLEAGQPQSMQANLEDLSRTGSASAAALAMLLLAHSEINKSKLRNASELLARISEMPDFKLLPRIEWHYQYLLAKLEFAGGRADQSRILIRGLLAQVSKEDHALRARLELFSGVLALYELQFTSAEQALHRALEHCLEAKWWWGIQAVYANFGLVCIQHSEQPNISINPDFKRGWLVKARDWFEQALKFCKETGLHHQSSELLVWTARVKRLLGEVDRVGQLLDEALLLAQHLGSDRAQAEVYLEKAEVSWHLGQVKEADRYCENALNLPLSTAELATLKQRIDARVLVA
jgi:MalT-like TPR region